MSSHEPRSTPYNLYRLWLPFVATTIRRISVRTNLICHTCFYVHPQFYDFTSSKYYIWTTVIICAFDNEQLHLLKNHSLTKHWTIYHSRHLPKRNNFVHFPTQPIEFFSAYIFNLNYYLQTIFPHLNFIYDKLFASKNFN